MPGRTAKVTITERQHDLLETIRNAPTASSQLRQRATIVLLAFRKRSNEEIATEVGLSRRQVSTLAATLGRCLGSAHPDRVHPEPSRVAPGRRADPPR